MTRRYVALTPEQKEQKRRYVLEQQLQHKPRDYDDYPTIRSVLTDNPYLEENIEETLEAYANMHRDDVEEEVRYEVDEDATEEEIQAETDRRYRDMLLDHYQQQLDEAGSMLVSSDGDDVWRVVILPANVDPTTLRDVGRYWTRDRELATAFWADRERLREGKVWRFRARVDADYIDLVGALEANAYGIIVGNETDSTEVRFFRSAPVFVYEVDLLDADPRYAISYEDPPVLDTIEINDYRRA